MGVVSSSSGDREINDKFSVDSSSGKIITNEGLIGLNGIYHLNVITVEEQSRSVQAKVSTKMVSYFCRFGRTLDLFQGISFGEACIRDL